MLKTLKNTIERLEALSLRERTLICVTVLVGLVMALQAVLIDPLTERHIQTRNQIRLAMNLNQGLESQLRNSPNVKNLNRQRELEAEINVVEEQMRVIDSGVADYAASLISPKEMPRLLQILLAEESLQLVTMKNVPPIPVVDRVTEEQNADMSLNESAELYRHGILISLRGEYPAVVNYLEKLESQTWKLIWHSMKYEVIDYPTGQVELHLQTLSTDRRWLGV